MTDIVNKIRGISGLRHAKGCSYDEIDSAQEELGLKFPEEFIEYVKEFGCIDFGSTEWIGLNIKGYLNTVIATKQERIVNTDFPKGYFVLEDMNIDAKKVIVNEDGKVFILQYEKLDFLCDTISEYLDICMERNK